MDECRGRCRGAHPHTVQMKVTTPMAMIDCIIVYRMLRGNNKQQPLLF
jgi:hypothetical protein